MTAEHPVSDLMNDHRLIEAVLSGLERQLSTPGEFPAEFVERCLMFLVEYADHFHHHKEEEVLFPALADRGVPTTGGPIGMMLHEHTIGRKLLAGIREALPQAREGDESARSSTRSCALQYIELLRNHIWKEDNVLFVMARRALDPQSADEVLARFAAERQGSVPAAALAEHVAFAASLGAAEAQAGS